jgi:Xaa-Pro dipeptidase
MFSLSQGRDTYKVPLSLFADNRQKLVDRLLAQQEENGGFALVPIGSLIYIQGGPSPTRYDTDHEPIFRQESYMWWLTGVKEPDVSVVIEVTAPSCHTTLLIPKLAPEYATIMGKIRSRDEWKSLYQVDQVVFTEELEVMLEEKLGSPSVANDTEENKLDGAAASITSTPQKLLLLQGTNSDSGLTYQPPAITNPILQRQVDTSLLFPILAECRVIKSQAELELLQAVAQVSSYAHAYVMRNTKPGMMEYQCESLFHFYSYYNYGCRLVSYTSICACGPNAAVLHYGHAGEPNSRQLTETDGCLFDMGAEYQGYASDITCSFPANGTFSDVYRPIYEAVLQAQIAVYNLARPGVSWVDCHKAAEREILVALQRIGIVTIPRAETKNDNPTDEATTVTIDDLVERRLGAVFMPHGLGHLIGIDTHDVGGYLPGHPERSPLPGLKSLRTSRILQENMVLTVEPGCYFIDHLLDEIFNSTTNDDNGGTTTTHPLAPYLNATELQKYRGTGGVRLEDMVAITKDGCVNFTCCPRTVSEVEHVMARGMWPPTKDEAPELRRIHLTTPILLGSPLPAPIAS